MKHIRKFLPLAISLLAVCALLLALRPAANLHAAALSLIQTTIEDFNTGTFFHTGMTRYADGEVSLLRSGLASQWISTTNSTGLIPRYSHASVIYNNRLYVFGGQTSLNSTRSIQYAAINTVTHNLSNWITSTVTLPSSIYTSTGYDGNAGVASLSAVQLNNRVYLLGGDDGYTFTYRTVTFASFTITGELTALTTTTPLPQALSEGQAVVQNGLIYYIGGRNNFKNGTDKVYYAQPDPVTGIITTWYTATSLLPYPTYAHMAVATSDGRLYSMGGVSLTSGSGIEPYVYYAEPLSTTGDILTWISTTVLPNNNFGGAGVTFGGQIFPTGGAVNGLSDASPAVYAAFIEDGGGISGSWYSTNPITPARLLHTAVVNPTDGWIYVVGGYGGSGSTPIQQYLVNAGATSGGQGSNYASYGRFTATPFDLGKNYPSTALIWETIFPNDSSIDTVSLTLRYRYRPDGGFYSNWSSLFPAQHIGGAAVTTVPITTAARFIQYEAFFTSSSNITTPILTYVQLDYVIPTPPKMLKVADPPNGSIITPSDVITYMIYFTNTSGTFLNGVVISDPVPAGVTYIPGSITAFISSGVIVSHPDLPEILWAIPTLPDLAVGYVGYSVRVDAIQPGDVIYNQAELNNELIRSDSPVVNHQYGSALQLSKSHVTSAPAEAGAEGIVQPGDIITYTLVYTNPLDGVDAPGAVLTDVLPANVTFLRWIGSPAPTVNSSPPSLRWDIGYLARNVTGTVGLVIQLNNNYTQWPDGSSVDNMAQLKATGRSLVRSNFGTPDSAPVRYRFVLWMDQSVNATKASPGSLLTYTTRLTNVTSMPIDLTGLTVYANLDPRPSSLSFTGTYVLNCASSCQGWYPSQVNPLVNQLVYYRTLPTLGPNQSTVISLVARISSTLPAGVLGVENLACASTDGIHGVQLDATRSCAETITAVAGPDIAVLGIQTPQRTIPNRATRFWVNVTNQGFTKTLGPDGLGWFGVDLYVKPVGSAPPFNPFDRQYGYCDQPKYNYPCTIQATHYATVNFTTTLGAGGLAANTSLSVPFTLTINTPGLYWLYAQADPFWAAGGSPSPTFGTFQDGRIMEADELNNIFGPVLINVGYSNIYLPLVRKNY